MNLSPFIAEILRWLIGMLLLAAAYGKLRHLAEFRRNLVGSFGVPERFSSATAAVIIGAESLVAAIILGWASPAGMWLALTMFAGFTAVLSYKFVIHSVVRCNCFGESGRPVSGYDLLRNVLVILACMTWLLISVPAMPPLHTSVLAAALASVFCVIAMDFHEIVILLVEPDGQ